MDLNDLTKCSGIAIRRLRYVIFHNLVPGIGSVDGGRGFLRSFSPYEAFAIAAAALLLDSGVKRQLVAECFQQLGGTPVSNASNSVSLQMAFSTRGPASILIADGRYARLCATLLKRGKAIDTGWRGMNGGTPPVEFDPAVLLQVRLAPLRAAVQQAAAREH